LFILLPFFTVFNNTTDDLEKEVARLKSLFESSHTNGAINTRKYRPTPSRTSPSAYEEDDTDLFISRELGVSFREVVALLERLLHKMSQMEHESLNNSEALMILGKAGKWIECIKFYLGYIIAICILF
jgi:hypothetical protein